MTDKSKSYGRHNVRPNLSPTPLLKDQNYVSNVWTAKVVTLFPEMFPGTLGYSVLGRALQNKLWSLETINLRTFGVGKHNDVDGTPSGGGPGMVLRADVIDKALTSTTENLNFQEQSWPIINLSPRGRPLSQVACEHLANQNGIILLCGRFEGTDERVIDKWNMQEISLGDFILTGGEIAAQALIDSVVRNIPNVLGNELSITNESFNDGLLEYPQYTKPSDWDGQKVPKVLLSGDHGEIVRWRNNQALEITKKRRPDLLKKFKKKLHDLPITSLHKQKKVK